MDAIFWLSLGAILYVYAGYPVLLDLWARAVRARRRRQTSHASASRTARQPLPGVTVVVAARNEAARLPARIENLLACEYPHDRLQIVVASDGSTDDTVAALAPFDGRAELLMLPPAGKASALNAAVARARHPILVFADARQRFGPDAIRRLVAHFDHPQIGAVSGELVLDCEMAGECRTPPDAGHGHDGQGRRDRGTAPHSTIADGVGAYWRYEKWLRRREAVVGSTLGVTGAIYAMRRDLWQPLPADTLLDDVLGPMRLVLAGYRVTFDERARAYDRVAGDAPEEMRRKVRTLAGNYQLLKQEPRLLVPLLNPVWLQFMSHKIGRLLVPWALVALLVSSAALARESAFHAAILGGQLAFYALALYGGVLDRRARSTPAGAREVYREAA
jgi:poly-beta-1,6-N-acetyl-D-glucosamine synthase